MPRKMLLAFIGNDSISLMRRVFVTKCTAPVTWFWLQFPGVFCVKLEIRFEIVVFFLLNKMSCVYVCVHARACAFECAGLSLCLSANMRVLK